MPCRRKTLLATTGLALVAVTGCSTGQAARPGNSPDSAMPMVQASRSHCGQGWTRAEAGEVQVTVRNTDVNAEEVYLANGAGKLYGEVDPLGPGASAALRTSLAAGTYHLVCSVNDGSPVHGPDISVTGDAAGAPGVQPVTSAQLAPAVIGYQRRVTARLKTLQGEAKTLTAALRRDDGVAARSAWRAANRTWNTMGGAYGAFGALGEAVAGTAFPFPDGVRDAHWTGLLRIEYGLWHGQSPASLAALGGVLQRDLTTLRKQLQTMQFQPIDVVNRTHEITEDTLQQTLTGHHDYGAHAQLSDALAQLDSTAELLDVLHPLLAPRFPGLAEADRWIVKTRNDIDAQDRWNATPPNSVPTAGHQLLDSDISQLAELLTPVPTILEPRTY